MTRTLLLTVLLGAGIAQAQPAPHRDGGSPPPPMSDAFSPEALATIPDLTAAQQVEVRKILIQRRDAHDAVRAKERAEHDAQRARARAENERIDDASGTQLRKLLGDDGYRNLAEWLAKSQRPHGPGRGMRGPPDRAGADATPASPDGDNDPQARVR